MPQGATPTLSVVTICYNDASHLERTIESVRVAKKSYSGLEYIVVDGASKDDTPNILKHHTADIDLLISEPDKGIYDAMNKGLKVAKGDYICFLNSGDKLHKPEEIGKLMEEVGAKFLKNNSTLPGVLYGETHLVDEEGHFVKVRTPRTPKRLHFRSFMKGMCVCHQSFYALRLLTEPYKSDVYRLSGDFDWCLNILRKSSYNYDTHRILTDYLSEGLTTRNRLPSLKERFQIMVIHYGLLSTLLAHIYFVLRLPLKLFSSKLTTQSN